MGVIFADISTTCVRCQYASVSSESPWDECGLCRMLGDRCLVWYMRAMKEAGTDKAAVAELRARFAAARGRSWQWPQVDRVIKSGESLPPGLLQRELERRREREARG